MNICGPAGSDVLLQPSSICSSRTVLFGSVFQTPRGCPFHFITVFILKDDPSNRETSNLDSKDNKLVASNNLVNKYFFTECG